MALTRMKYTPETGLKDKEKFPATPVSEDAAREQFQRLFDQVKDRINALIGELENRSENSGAKMIGCGTIDGISGSTIYEKLVSLRDELRNANAANLIKDSVVTEHIKNGSITFEKMDANSVGKDQMLSDSISETAIQDHAVSTDKLGIVSKIMLSTYISKSYEDNDTTRIVFNDGKMEFHAYNCAQTYLAPVVYSEDAPSTTTTYPAGTLYVQYV
jgi:hypothetical protein